MRLHPALALAAVLLPALAAAQTDEWVRDDMSDESLWLLRTSNLAREAPRAGTLPGAPDGGSHWVMSKGDGPAYVVYFIPGRIHEVEIDTHRLAGASGDFTLAVSADGKLYQPLDAGAVLLDTSFGWDYRLMASDQIPENATHLLVQFPDGSTAHSLSEVWIRYTWDDALVSRFLPEPVTPPAQQEMLAAHSDAELQAMVEALVPQAAPPAAREVFPIADETPETIAPSEFVAEPLRAPHLAETSAPVQLAAPQDAGSAAAPVKLAEELSGKENESETVAAVSSDPAPAQSDATSTIEPLVAEPEMEPMSEGTVDANDLRPISVEPAEMPVSETAPIDPAPVTTDTVAVATVEETGKAVQEPASDAAPLATVDIAGAGESIAASPTESLAPADETREAEAPEEVHVLPTFTLPVFASAEPNEAPTSPEFESPPPSTAESVVLENATPAIVAASQVEPDKPDSIESIVPADETPATDVVVQEAQPSPQDPDSGVVAATVAPEAPADASQLAEFTADDEPKAKPAMKMRRMGPRSKSRGTLVARD
jgi:hypothetical protein